jgi:predicted nucleic acid-binding protein
MTKTYVLDASALLDLVEAGPGFGKVEQLLQSALRNQALVLTSVLNWGEVFYLLWQSRGEEKARQAICEFVAPSAPDHRCRFFAGASSW